MSNAYREDIDGLRAFAVLAVTVFHLNASWLPSGFLGVDVFFVLSGFLITSILYRDILQGSFKFVDFYTRRIKRILPAFFVVLFVGLAISYFFCLPDYDHEVGKSAAAAVIFLANALFAKQGGYFDLSSDIKPFLHIWSLSVEEQFYFIFPSLLILLIYLNNRYISKKRQGSSEENSSAFMIYWGLLLLLLLSLFSSFFPLGLIGLDWEPYYLPHIRFGEMLSGSLLAVFMSREVKQESYDTFSFRLQANLFGSIAFVVLIACMLPEHLFVGPWFPGPLALLPCLATGVLLYYNRSNYWVSKLLSWKPIVWIGKLSYSLYLWHWVVLAFIRYFRGAGELSLTIVLVVSVLMLVLSIITYYCVEQPIRRLNLSFRSSLVYCYLLPGALVIGIFFAPKEYYPIDQELSSSYLNQEEWITEYNGGGDEIFGDEAQEPTILVAGDSHAGHLSGFIDYLGKKEGWSACVSTVGSCPFFIGYDFRKTIKLGKRDFCKVRNERLAEQCQYYETIILANFWGSEAYSRDEDFIPCLKNTLDTLQSLRKNIILINSAYFVENTRLAVSYLSFKGIQFPWGDDEEIQLRGEEFYMNKENAARIRDWVRSKYPRIRWIDLVEYHPERLLIEGLPIMVDRNHLNVYGAREIAKIFSEHNRLIE